MNLLLQAARFLNRYSKYRFHNFVRNGNKKGLPDRGKPFFESL